jgi:ketosteroid isomerase-like protein
MNRILSVAGVCTALNVSSLLAQAAPPGLAREVFVAESSFAASMARRDLKAFAALISPEAVFFNNTTALRGKDAIVEDWRKFFLDAIPPFSWRPETVEVLSSGTLALTSGPVHDPGGKLVGTFTSIWRREADGSWRVIFDKGGPPPAERR